MKAVYDPETDTLRVIFTDAPVEESDEEKSGLILDYDKNGNIVGLEVLQARSRIDDPQSFEYAVAS